MGYGQPYICAGFSPGSSMCWGQGPKPVTTEDDCIVTSNTTCARLLTLRVAAGLYQGVGPLAAAGQGTVGQARITRDAIGRNQGAGASNINILMIHKNCYMFLDFFSTIQRLE